MKDFLKFIIRFIILLIIIFSIIFLFLFLFNMIPIFKIPKNEIDLKEFSKDVFFPVFFNSLFHSFIIAIFINSFAFLRKQKKLKILSFFFPIIFSGIIIFIVLFFVKLDSKKLNLTKINDLRLFFTPNSLFNYEPIIKQKFSEYDFEKNIIDKIVEKKDKDFVSRLYYKDLNSGDYILRKKLNPKDSDRIRSILYSIGFFEPVMIYFLGKDAIKKNFIQKLVLIDKDGISFYNDIKAEFIEDRFFLIFPDKRFEFYKDSFREYNVYESFVSFLFEKVGRISYIFTENKNNIINTVLFIGLIFLIQSFVSLIGFKEYRFISFMINFTFLFLLLVYGYDIMIFSTNLFKIFVSNMNIIHIINIGILIVTGVIINMLNFLFFKSGIWESN
ncbi:MAG TPA: hypothetical protein PLE45_08275 [Spirochaetota bacterium]|nr:hypothetical protein [Spirochaetota bacterium]HPP04283.1 hypothetical protein [Spirochaetota bacterium]